MSGDEELKLDPDIEIVIIDIRGDKVRLGLSTPAHLPVHRKEVFDILQGRTPFTPDYGD